MDAIGTKHYVPVSQIFFNRRTSFFPCSLGWVCCKTVLKRTATVEITRLKLSQRIIDFTFGFGIFLGLDSYLVQ